MKLIGAISASLAILGGVGVSACGAVVDSSSEGFTVRVERTVNASPDKAFQCLTRNIDRWWESSHTISGQASNLYLEARAKGWFGERLPGGGAIRHMEVIYVVPGKVLRLEGALGPLQEYAVSGVMTWRLKQDGRKTRLSLVYCVGGYRPGGLKDFARPVDKVLTGQIDRLKVFVETGSVR